uniref:Uncharacterized protein n=1 Tax=Rhizophora mucronata TaxID=61149 RepID=A0A2P2PG52_RHIMU
MFRLFYKFSWVISRSTKLPAFPSVEILYAPYLV